MPFGTMSWIYAENNINPNNSSPMATMKKTTTPTLNFLFSSFSYLFFISITQCLPHSLRLVITRPWSDGVHMTPVSLCLRVHLRIFEGSGDGWLGWW